MSDERRNDKRAIFMLRLASEDFDKKPSPHGLLDYFDGEDEFTESDAIRAALRELDRLTTERDQAREQLAKLRAACDGTPWLLETARERDGSSWDYPWPEVYDDAAARIRAALESEESDG